MRRTRRSGSKASAPVSGADIDSVNALGLRRILLLAFGSPSVTVDIHDPDDVGRLLRDLCVRRAESAASLLDVAAAKTTPLEDLRFIKELAKRLLKNAPHSAGEAEAVHLLYHVAVAAAISRFRVDMSRSSPADRSLLYERLGIVFAGHPIGDVFRAAAGRIGDPGASRSRHVSTAKR